MYSDTVLYTVVISHTQSGSRLILIDVIGTARIFTHTIHTWCTQ